MKNRSDMKIQKLLDMINMQKNKIKWAEYDRYAS